MKTTTLIVPGLHGSEDEHWQSWWQRQDSSAVRVQQQDWHHAELSGWSQQVENAILAARPDKVWLVAHSFGCLASVHAALKQPERIAGLFLVAPADPDRFGIHPARLLHELPVPSLMVASTTDPYLSHDKARLWARVWGSQFINLGDVGHINVASGFGPWPQGMRLFNYFQSQFADAELEDYWRLSA